MIGQANSFVDTALSFGVIPSQGAPSDPDYHARVTLSAGKGTQNCLLGFAYRFDARTIGIGDLTRSPYEWLYTAAEPRHIA